MQAIVWSSSRRQRVKYRRCAAGRAGVQLFFYIVAKKMEGLQKKNQGGDDEISETGNQVVVFCSFHGSLFFGQVRCRNARG
jgi:hypothetical protein